MKLIAISGLDGSGKSTQIQLLKNYLESQGKKVFYFHAIDFSLANKLSGNKNAGSFPSVTKANLFKIWLRKIFLRIDLWRFGLLRNKLRNNYDYLISDRYFYDSAINIKYLSNSQDFSFLKLSFRKICKPDLTIYLQINPEQIMQRERKPDQGLEYLKVKKDLYDKFAQEFGLKIIDGNQDKEVIFAEIKKEVVIIQ